jgi:hypothetical protein
LPAGSPGERSRATKTGLSGRQNAFRRWIFAPIDGCGVLPARIVPADRPFALAAGIPVGI